MRCINCGFNNIDHSPWLTEARKWIGQKEVKGRGSNPWIIGLWAAIPWIWDVVGRKDDSRAAWCGAFIRMCFKVCGLKPPKAWWRAKSFIGYGIKLDKVIVGAVCVFKFPNGRYHVSIAVGKDHAGNVAAIGGNQSDSVKVSMFKMDYLVYCGWPDERGVPQSVIDVPIITAELGDGVV